MCSAEVTSSLLQRIDVTPPMTRGLLGEEIIGNGNHYVRDIIGCMDLGNETIHSKLKYCI